MTTTIHHLTIGDLEAGVRQRLGFDRGRATAIAVTKAALSGATAAVRRALDVDTLALHPARGRAARIADTLRSDPAVTAYLRAVDQRYRETRPCDGADRRRRWIARILGRLTK